jgi:guanosine-3',5'-bis(diphosphate) 3'-pyrophosphohydrolase
MNDLSDTKLLVRAIEFAARKHRMQRRKDVDASPYINHPIAVMSVLCVEAGIDDATVLAAAALHDTIEDTETTQAELEREFGKEIAGLVGEMTDDKSLPKEQRKRLQIEHAHKLSGKAALVKLADKTCNVRDIAAHPPFQWGVQQKSEYFEWAKAVVDCLPESHPTLRRLFNRAYESSLRL